MRAGECLVRLSFLPSGKVTSRVLFKLALGLGKPRDDIDFVEA